MVSENIIKKKINAIQHSLERIRRYQDISLEGFLADEDARDIVTHNLFIMLQNIIDIGTHLISDLGLEEPDFLADIPGILVKEKIIISQLEKPIRAMIGLRNMIAHEYGELDFKIIHTIITAELEDVNQFLTSIINYCQF